MLKVVNATKYYGDFLAVDNLSFSVERGEIFGLLGVNGSGKTTTFRMIMGLLDHQAKEISLNGAPIDYSVTDRIGFLTEERSLLTKLTVKEQFIFYGVLKGMSEEKVVQNTKALLEKFGISDYWERPIKELSKGNQQKIQFITAIMNEPDLLILDEPFAGLDPLNVELFRKEIMEMAEKGCMIIFSTHRMEHVELFCKKIVIIQDGKAVLSGEIAKIKEEYQQKNILVNGEGIKQKDLKAIDGVVAVAKNGADFEVKIKDISYLDNVFEQVKEQRIYKFMVQQPSLNEIFVAKVGEKYGA